MKKAKSALVMVLALILGVPVLGGPGAGPRQKPQEPRDLMKRKLGHSQKVLEGVAVGDFDTITRHAGELIAASREAEWKVVKTPRYEVHSNEFRRTAETLIENAKAKNLDGAALAYVDLTLTCVKCHKHVREVRLTRTD